jgi:hypothetical protein
LVDEFVTAVGVVVAVLVVVVVGEEILLAGVGVAGTMIGVEVGRGVGVGIGVGTGVGVDTGVGVGGGVGVSVGVGMGVSVGVGGTKYEEDEAFALRILPTRPDPTRKMSIEKSVPICQYLSLFFMVFLFICRIFSI